MIIRNQPSPLTPGQGSTIETVTTTAPSRKAHARHFGNISGAAIVSYAGVFLLVVTLVMMGYQPPVRQTVLATSTGEATSTSSSATGTTHAPAATVDQLTAANLASSLAETTDLPISNDVANLSQSLAVESQLSQTDTNVISKPQVVNPSADARTTKQYTTVAGDTVQSVAQRYGISATTIKWANNLTSDVLEVGKTIAVPPVNGIMYTVKSGDSLDSISSKYAADRALMVAYNDLESSGEPAVGARLIIPGGQLPSTEQPGYVVPTSSSSYSFYGYGSISMSAGNRYGYGQCTWYAYERRVQLGSPVGGMWGNANSWSYWASASGFLVDGNPAVGAVMQDKSGYYGHVAIVESVNPGVSVTISEMNGYRFPGGGWNRIGRGDIPWDVATSSSYKYIH